MVSFFDVTNRLSIHDTINYIFFIIFFRTQSEIIAEVLDKMGLGSEDMSLQEKLDALCLIFKHTITENAQ